LDKAIEAFEIAIEDEPVNSVIVLSDLRGLYIAKGDQVKAIHVFERAIKENPKDSWLWTSLGSNHKARGDVTTATKACRRTL